jgi:2'-5' RNA ligase
MRYRLFAALELPAPLRAALESAQASFKAAAPSRSVRWVAPENIHLTIKFYGDVPAERVPELEAGLARAAASARPIMLAVQGLGVFPNLLRPQVIWVGLEGDRLPLQALVAAVEAEAEMLGFPPEAREFTPHLTLGRVRAGLAPAAQR